MKKKGKSNDDKKLIIYNIMLESESFFILKELESLASSKGIRSIFVKDLIQQLIDDDKIKCEKVGAQNIYWVLKTEESSILQHKYDELKAEKLEYDEKIKQETEEYKKILDTLQYSDDELNDKLEEAKLLLEQLDDKNKQLEIFKKMDIKEIEKMKIQNEFAAESIQRWNNNIFIVKQWIQSRTDKSGEIIDRLLGIKDIFNNRS
ncbi:meiotic nuclear division protein 1, putative [Hepatocystis sp. ex Piliocolobus tephrosceles]|nr:meiotic nuclear division protein 1, putative [Hepatocystis sp. ex Piliocolobus tephrosceles]